MNRWKKRGERRKEGRRWRNQLVSLPTLTAENQTHVDKISSHTQTLIRCGKKEVN